MARIRSVRTTSDLIRWFFGLIGFLLINAPGVQADLTQKIMGEWKGNGTQYSGESWTIQLLVQPSGACSISYPSLRCGGDLLLLDQSETSARFRENIKYGKDCIDQGTIRLIQMQPDKLEFFWYLPSGQLQAKGELIQVRKYAPDPKTSPPAIPFYGPK
jgi:hypothetical protein